MADVDVEVIQRDPEFQAFRSQLHVAAAKRAAGTLYEVARELGKKRLLRNVLEDAASDLDGLDLGLEYAWSEVKASKRHPDDWIKDVLGSMQVLRHQEGEVMIAEIVAKRSRIDEGFGALENVTSMTEEQQAEFDRLESASSEQNELTLRAVAAGKVAPRKAAQSAIGSEAL